MTDYSRMKPGEFWATIHKAIKCGASFDTWTLDDMISGFPLTPEELSVAERDVEAHRVEIEAMRAARAA